jgi:Cdc6-like AAA superfamily ATPase
MKAYREGQADLRRYMRAIARARERMRAGGGAASTPCYANVCLGREAELQAIEQWFHTHGAPLLTLIGPSGIGKTHLACAFLQQLQAAGVPCVYVNLTLLSRAEQILASLFHTLDLSFPTEGVWQRVAARLFVRGRVDRAGRF